MEVVKVPIADLRLDPANVRKHPERNLATIEASLARFGQQRPILVDLNNVVRAGNGTLQAAVALGWREIAVVYTELAGSEATAYAIADNRAAEQAVWDDAALAETLRALQSEDFDLDAVGFAGREVDELLKGLGDEAAVGEPEPAAADGREGRYGVLVMCKDEAAQKDVCGRLLGEGYECKAVAI